MIMFWATCAVFVAIALAFVIPSLLAAPKKASDGQNQEANVEVYRDQLSELEADLQNGIISREQYQQDRDEIERRLLDDVSAAEDVLKEKRTDITANRGPVYAIA